MRKAKLILILLTTTLSLMAQKGHEIKVSIDGYERDVLYMAYHFGSKQYVKDTVYRQPDDSFVFSGEEPLAPGIYMLVMDDTRNFLEFLITSKEQNFGISFNKSDLLGTSELSGKAKENRLYFDYLKYLAEQRKKAEALKASDESGQSNSQKELDAITEQVLKYQKNLIKKNPKSLTAAIIKSTLSIDYPEFTGTKEEKDVKRWRYTQAHYFDNFDLSDNRMLRTPLLEKRVDHFVQKLQVQHPDTISKAIDYVLDQMEGSEENFQYFVVHFVNHYARSKVVGQDAVYVHIIDNYYAKGKAPWTDKTQLKKMTNNADKLRPLLIGKIAPDLNLQKRDGSPQKLHDIQSDYTVLYFWRYDCGHCKESTPHLKEFYEKFKDQGVSMVAVCTKFTDEVAGCWDYVDEKEINDWIHLADPYSRSRFTQVYNILSTPQIYILDKDKKILSKRIGATQLEEVMDNIMKRAK